MVFVHVPLNIIGLMKAEYCMGKADIFHLRF